MTRGTLYLIPVPLGVQTPAISLPASTLACLRGLRRFVVESAKSARAVLKAAEHPLPLRELAIAELNEHTPAVALDALLAPLLAGEDVGLLSEAGCPAVADPGSSLVELAHRNGVRVAPLVGPSSLLLALMASGLNGQGFAFHGYLPVKDADRVATIKRLENNSAAQAVTMLFIETPYRNARLFDALLATCAPRTRLCVAVDLTLPTETIQTAAIADWRRRPPPDLDRRPAVFLLQAG